MAVNVIIAAGSVPTGKVLMGLLNEGGMKIAGPGANVDAVIRYGVGGNSGGIPTLNAKAGGSKLAQLQLLQTAKVPVPKFAMLPLPNANALPVPALCRLENHKGGKDIRIALQPEDFAIRHQQGYRYATEFVPIQDEFRVWIYRRQHLGTYKKVLRYPEKYKRIGRNFDNGFAFELVKADGVPRDAVAVAANAVQALQLDFGAVDIIQSSKDHAFYVLEVNTAPGVEGEHRQVIKALADKMIKWQKLGYPKRKGAGE